MIPTNSYIQTSVTIGREAAVSGWVEYYDQRRKGKVCNNKLIDFGVLFAFIDAIDGYDVDNEDDFCLTAWEATEIATAIRNLASVLNSSPISFITNNILTEDGNDMMTEDGDNLIWI